MISQSLERSKARDRRESVDCDARGKWSLPCDATIHHQHRYKSSTPPPKLTNSTRAKARISHFIKNNGKNSGKKSKGKGKKGQKGGRAPVNFSSFSSDFNENMAGKDFSCTQPTWGAKCI